MICLNSKTLDFPQKLSNYHDILPELNGYVAAVYECDKIVYIGKAIDVDQTNVNVSFFNHEGEIFQNSVFIEPRKKGEIWIEMKNLLCILPAPLE